MGSLLLRLNPQTQRILALLVVLLLVGLFFSTQIPNYFNGRLCTRVTSSVAIMALIATGQTVVVLTRNIDLSVGAVVGFVAFAAGSLISTHPDLHPLLLVLYAAGVGALFGALNGALVAYARIPSIIVTLASMAIVRSSLVEFSKGQSITTAQLPQWLVDFPNLPVFSLGEFDFRAGFLTAFAIVLVAHFLLGRFRPARRFYAVGSNPEAAEMAGINTRATVFAAFLISGVLAGLAGLMFLARFGNITVVAGLGFELRSVAAVVLGGVNIFGGSGTVIGAFIGAVLVDLIEFSLVRWPVVSEFWREAVLGALILLAVSADAVLMRRLTILRSAWQARRQAAEARRGGAAS